MNPRSDGPRKVGRGVGGERKGGYQSTKYGTKKKLTYLTNELVTALGSATTVFSLASSLVCPTSRGGTKWELEMPRRRGRSGW